jgi:hypothetical protein
VVNYNLCWWLVAYVSIRRRNKATLRQWMLKKRMKEEMRKVVKKYFYLERRFPVWRTSQALYQGLDQPIDAPGLGDGAAMVAQTRNFIRSGLHSGNFNGITQKWQVN